MLILSFQFLDFVRTIDAKFENYDMEGGRSYVACDQRINWWYTIHSAAWPSTIDDFVQWAKERLASEA